MAKPAGRGERGFAGNPLVRVLLPFAAAYFLSYLYRSVNAVIAPDLVSDFALSAAELGLLTSAYFLTFAAFQLPLGLLLDRFGPRRTDAALLLIAALGGMVFALAHGLPLLILGRALIGLGVSGSLSYVILSHRFPVSLAGRVNTALNSMVFAWAFIVQWGVGAVIGLWPATAAGFDAHGYRAAFGLFLAVEIAAWTWMLVETRRLPARGAA
jgi:MFS family permease